MNKTNKLKKLTAIAMLCALAFICTIVLKIPVNFLTLDIKDSIITLCALFFGTLYGAVAALIVPLLEFLLISDTGVYGLIMNIIASMAFCVPVGLIYKRKRTLFGAILGLVASVVSMTAMMMLANLLITPYYMGVSVDDVIRLLPTLLLPFNLVKATLNAAIVLILYKPLSRSFKRMHLTSGSQTEESMVNEGQNYKKSALVIIAAAIVIVISLVMIFAILDGSISLFDAFRSK